MVTRTKRGYFGSPSHRTSTWDAIGIYFITSVIDVHVLHIVEEWIAIADVMELLPIRTSFKTASKET